MRQYYVYILASHSRRLYVGITNDLAKRLYYHLSSVDSFAARYRMNRLVHFEAYEHPMNAIAREKQIKGWVRRRKIELIEKTNPAWLDLASGWLDVPPGHSNDS